MAITSQAGAKPRMREQQTTKDDVSRLWQEAEFYEKQGLFDHAILVYQNILEKEPTNRKVQAKIVQVQFNKKMEDTTPSRPSSSEEHSPRLALDLGIAYMGMSLYPEALEEFEKALKPSPPFRTEIQRYMIACLIRLHKYEEAQKIFHLLLGDRSLTPEEKEDIVTETIDAFLELGLAGQVHSLLIGLPDPYKEFVRDYDDVLEEFASADLTGGGFEVLVEDTETGQVYREPLTEPEDLPTEQPTQELEASIALRTTVSYSKDNKIWREGTSSRISADWALLHLPDDLEPGDSLVLQIHLPSGENNERVWVISKVGRPASKSSLESGEVKVRFVSFLPGGETLLKSFIDEVVRDPSMLSDDGNILSGRQPAPPTDVFSVMETDLTSVMVAGTIPNRRTDSERPESLTEESAAPAQADSGSTRVEQKARIRFACECGQVHVVPMRTVGRKGKCGKCGRTMTVPVVDARPDSLSSQLTGKIVGGCRLLYKIGGGGMGGVFKGHHIALDIPVAVKVLHAHLAEKDPVFIKRFIREARSAAKLQHPNIVGVMNVGVENGLHFLVMPFVEGGSAATTLARTGKFRLEKVLHVAVDVTRALTVAEEQGMLHRDIKPANILFTKKGDAMLADLGLAKNYLDAQDSGITQTGIACGTPLYFSPEQAKGSPIMDIRSDIYSLGITLFHLLEGSPPFMGESAYVIFQKHVHEDLPHFKTADPPVPDAVFKVIQKMTNKAPKERYSSARELLDVLETLREDMLRAGKPKPRAKKSFLERLGIRKPG